MFAIDGSVLNLPQLPTMISYFGGQPKRRGGKIAYPIALLSVLLDVGCFAKSARCLQPYALGEQVAAAEHVGALPTNALTRDALLTACVAYLLAPETATLEKLVQRVLKKNPCSAQESPRSAQKNPRKIKPLSNGL